MGFSRFPKVKRYNPLGIPTTQHNLNIKPSKITYAKINMPLDQYLSQHYLNAEQFAAACTISVTELKQLIQHQLIPAAAYSVTADSTLKSYVFGEIAAPHAKVGQYFHPANKVWVMLAQKHIQDVDLNAACAVIYADFKQHLQAALAELNTTTWRLKDSFNDDGSIISTGLAIRTDLIWQHFLHGTFGLCVAQPDSEAAIASKEILQEKLSALSQQGKKSSFSTAEAQELLALIDALSLASMPFSPLEYPLSSRKRLIDDLRQRILSQHPDLGSEAGLTIRSMHLADASAVSQLLPDLGYSGNPSDIAKRF